MASLTWTCSPLCGGGDSSICPLAGVLVFSAIPFSAVKAIANSPVGEWLQNRMLVTKKAALQDSSNFKALAQNARDESLWYGEERPRWLGPIPFEYPEYLTGELPGDYGFDVAGLSKDPVAFQKYFNYVSFLFTSFMPVYFEILHARWAMLASLGAVIPEVLDMLGAFHFVEPVWWRVGYSKLQDFDALYCSLSLLRCILSKYYIWMSGLWFSCSMVNYGIWGGETLEYLGIPGLHLAGSQGVIVIAICQALLMVGPEYARYCGIEALEPLGIFLPGDINYPGGALFDPLKLSKDPVSFEDLKVKEIKNGRLAMVAWLGFYAQATLTGKGPVQNIVDHISDPFHNNLLSMLKIM
ncbi:hypothetical protein EZV62_027369 [Acer yangbiense]|uniref:Chlorophyll a-b binding protein, chloroplastic n=1 Tax=Acer yangbiense TaxID=1000413 RepID=A0A5C7GU16_9ROSI|nr:hypothetical protein EZV62_027369 [Acer yangbiense]